MGRAYAPRLGHGTKNLLDAAIHASEWLMTNLLMKMAENTPAHAQYDRPFGPYHVAEILEEVSLWFMPMLNSRRGHSSLEGPKLYKTVLLQNSYYSRLTKTASAAKANIAVD